MVVEARQLRSLSRRTPQPAPAGAADTSLRAMQADSHDVNSTRPTSPPQRMTRGKARAASVESVVSSSGAARASRKKAKQTGTVRELSTVEEEERFRRQSFSEPPAIEDHANHEGIHTFQPMTESQAEESSVPELSYSTSPETIHPPSDLDVVLMIDTLGDLYADANKVLEKIAPKNATQSELRTLYSEFRKPGSAVNRILSKRIERFEKSRENFGTTEYIRSATVNAALSQHTPISNVGSSVLQLDPILQMANLTSLAIRMRDIERETSETFDVLLRLDQAFPRDFLSNFDDGTTQAHTAEKNALFKIALEIRTQFAIRLISQKQDEEDFWPHQEILEVFFLSPKDYYNIHSEHKSLRGWELPGLLSADEGLPRQFEIWILERVAELRACLPGQDSVEDVDFEQLESKFPWSRFITQLLEWVSRRNEEIETEISSLGGIEMVQSALQECIELSDRQATSGSNIPAQNQSDDPHPPSTQEGQVATTAPGVISALKKLKQKVDRLSSGAREDAAAAFETRQARAPRTEEIEDEWQLIANEEEDISATAVEIQEPPPYAAKQVFMDQIRRMEKQNKENILRVQSDKDKTKSIFDRQPDAQKVSFDEDLTRQSPIKRSRAPSHSPAKRRRVEEDEDDEFETDQRQPVDRRRRETPVKRRRITPATRRATSIATTRGKVDGKEDVADQTFVDDVDEVSRLARRQGTALPPFTNGGAKRKRFPWTDDEDKQLMALYGIYGGGKQPWKRIKEADEAGMNVLHRRDPVALKDRARTLCFIYDKSNTGRPDVFEGLEIGNFYKRKVDQKLGRLPAEVPAD